MKVKFKFGTFSNNYQLLDLYNAIKKNSETNVYEENITSFNLKNTENKENQENKNIQKN